MKTVYVVHAVDTEGPLYESIEETFMRIQTQFGPLGFAATKENLKKLQNRELQLPQEASQREAFDAAFSPRVLNFIQDFAQLDQMLENIMSPTFRNSMKDDFGQGWLYNWHCMDHLDYEENPRRKAVGMHAIFDYYLQQIERTNSKDQIHWHFHPSTFNNEGNRSTTNYVYSKNLHKIIARRLIDRNWFPTSNRAGYHTERIDSHLFLEQWLPFDLSNQSVPAEDNARQGLQAGRLSDWRGAPSDWSIYHPSHDYYQIPGNCRRWISRCLNIGTRHHLLNQKEVDAAFALAQRTGKALLSFSNHDFRDMTPDMKVVFDLLKNASARFPDVKFKYADSTEAMRECIYSREELQKSEKISLSLELKGHIAVVKTLAGQTFGPQPFFCFKTRDRRYFYDNMDIVERGHIWSYTFDMDTIPLKSIEAIGVASNDKYGFRDIQKIWVD